MSQPNSIAPEAQTIILVVLGFAGVIASLMQTLVLPLLPVFPRVLHVSMGAASWIATSTMLVGAVSAPVLGWLGDRIGLKQSISLTLVILCLGSLIAALSNSLLPLLVGRTLQGVAVGLVGLSLALLRRIWPKRTLPMAIGLVSGTISIGTALGVPMAGLIIEFMPWQAIFWIVCVCSAVATGLFILLVPKVPVVKAAEAKPFDFVGATGLVSVVLLLLIPLGNANTWGIFSTPSLICFALFAVCTVLWVCHQLRKSHPFVDLRLAARPAIAISHLTALLLGFAFFLSFTATITVVQMPATQAAGLGGTVFLTGLVQLPASLISIASPPIAGAMVMRTGARLTVLAGITIAILAFFLRALNLVDPVLIASTAMFVSGGITFAFAALPVALMRATPMEHLGTTNGINILSRQLGSATASVAGAVIVATTLNPDTVNGQHAFYWLFGLGGGACLVALLLIFLARTLDAPEARVTEILT